MLRRPVRILMLSLLALLPAASAHAVLTPTTATIGWTAPGDDSVSGTATRYDVRLSTTLIDAGNFAAALRLSSVSAPHAAGTAESFLVTGLTPSTTYFVAIKTADEVPNWSGLSNVISFTTPASTDSIRPAPLAVALGTLTDVSVQLTWNATGDDSLTGTAAGYDVRWSASPINDANFAAATSVSSGVSAPAAPGSAQSVTIGGLNRTADLYFAIKVRDGVNHWSALSNVVLAPHLLDTAPPATPSGLTAAKEAAGVHVHWNANSEADLAGYHVFRALASVGPWTQLDASALAATDFVDASAPDSASLYYCVSAYDQTGNVSARSAAYRAWLKAGSIAALKLQPAYPNPSHAGDPVTLPVAVPVTGAADGKLVILDSAGERVRTIELRGLTPGVTPVMWDGRNDAGRSVAPGVYRAWLTLGGTQQVSKLVRQP